MPMRVFGWAGSFVGTAVMESSFCLFRIEPLPWNQRPVHSARLRRSRLLMRPARQEALERLIIKWKRLMAKRSSATAASCRRPVAGYCDNEKPRCLGCRSGIQPPAFRRLKPAPWRIKTGWHERDADQWRDRLRRQAGRSIQLCRLTGSIRDGHGRKHKGRSCCAGTTR